MEWVTPHTNLGANVMGTFQSDHSGNKSCKDFCTKGCTLDSKIIRIQDKITFQNDKFYTRLRLKMMHAVTNGALKNYHLYSE